MFSPTQRPTPGSQGLLSVQAPHPVLRRMSRVWQLPVRVVAGRWRCACRQHLAPSRAPETVVALVERMLRAEAGARPSVAEVHATLMGLRSGSGTPTRTRGRAPLPVRPPLVTRGSMSPSASPPTAAGGTPRAPSRLLGRGVRIAGSSYSEVASDRPSSSEPPPTGSGSRQPLMGKLLDRLEKRRTP